MRTLIVVKEFSDGNEICFPVADPTLASFGSNGTGLEEQSVFLEEYLPRQRPDVLAKFSFPPETELHYTDVMLEREDLPDKLQLTRPVTINCVVIPHGRDKWVIALPIDHTFHVSPKEDLNQAIKQEVRRMVSALELSPLEFSSIFPPQSYSLEELTVTIDLSKKITSGRTKGMRKTIKERKRSKDATDVLESVATPLHNLRDILLKPPLVSREPELEHFDALLSGVQRLSVMLVGQELTGKTALIHEWIRRNHKANKVRHVYATSGAQLIAGMSGLGQWEERVRRVTEAAGHLDALLYFDNLGDLFADHPDSNVDIASAMYSSLAEGSVRIVGEIRPEALDRFENRHVGFINCLHRLKIEPLSTLDTIRLLKERITHAKKYFPDNPVLDPETILPMIDLVDRYMPYQSHPGKAVRLYEELCTIHEQGPGMPDPKPIGEHQLYETFSIKCGIPVFLLRQDKPLELKQIIEFFNNHLVGQADAIRRVAETVCVIKARLQPPEKPLATFVFIGRTGIGKTELARSLARFLFGSEKRLIRFDMSEYMDQEAAQRLIRGTRTRAGYLTQQVRQQPFCVLLLDEIEKAHPAVFDLLLQVSGEGRLTDEAGRTVSFNNAIIIMTSNLGAGYRRDAIGITPRPSSDEDYYIDQVNRTFRPEFVNRLDRIIVFHPLDKHEVKQIAQMTIRQMTHRRGFTELGLKLEVSDPALEALARGGYSQQYGARHLRRFLENRLITPVARILSLFGEKIRGFTISVYHSDEADSGQPGADKNAFFRSESNFLKFQVIRAQSPRRRATLREISALSDLRRKMNRYLNLEPVQEVREQTEYLLAQLTVSNKKKGRKKKTGPVREIAGLQTEYHFLKQLWQPANDCCQEIETAEELALAEIFEHQSPDVSLDEGERIFRKFHKSLFYLLTAMRSHRDQATIMVQNINQGNALDYWLIPLLDQLGQRKWHIIFHGHRDKRTTETDWPVKRLWGPSMDASEMLKLAGSEQHATDNLLLRVNGPFAGVAMALEAGLHRYTAREDRAISAMFYIRYMANHSDLSENEWGDERLKPLNPISLGDLRRLPAAREYKSLKGPCRLTKMKREAEVPLSEYWERFEEIAVEHLLAYAEDDKHNLDELFISELRQKESDD